MGKIRNELGQINHDIEKLLGYLDQVRGDDEVRTRRKEIAEKANIVFARVDVVKELLNQVENALRPWWSSSSSSSSSSVMSHEDMSIGRS